MAFVAVVPAVGSAVLPALGTAVGGLGTLASSIPVVGGSLGSLLGTSAAGSGLAGALGSLGTGSLLGAGQALGTGLSGVVPAFGGMGTGMSGITGGLGQMYGGADALLGGMLPNLGVGGTVTPAQGFLGQMFPNAVGNNQMFGGMGPGNVPANPGGTQGLSEFFGKPIEGATQPAGGGMMERGAGMMKTIGDKAQQVKGLMDMIPRKEGPGSQAATDFKYNMQASPPPPPVVLGGQASVQRGLPMGGGGPQLTSGLSAGIQPYYKQPSYMAGAVNTIGTNAPMQFDALYDTPLGAGASQSLSRLA